MNLVASGVEVKYILLKVALFVAHFKNICKICFNIT